MEKLKETIMERKSVRTFDGRMLSEQHRVSRQMWSFVIPGLRYPPMRNMWPL